MVKKFHQEHRRSPHTPLPSENLVPYDGQASIQQVYSYQQWVGSINFAACITRPDIAHASSHLAEFSQNPSPKHLDAADHIIQYLHGTQNYALEFSPCPTGSFLEAFVKEYPSTPKPGASETGNVNVYLEASSDAAYADDTTTRRSSEGYLFKLFGAAIDWRAGKQRTVTTSTTEAELLSLTTAAKKAIWWQRFCNNIDLQLEYDLIIMCNNRQMISALEKDSPLLYTKLQHINIYNHWL